MVMKLVVVQKDDNGYGLTVSGDKPVYVQSVKPGICFHFLIKYIVVRYGSLKYVKWPFNTYDLRVVCKILFLVLHFCCTQVCMHFL